MSENDDLRATLSANLAAASEAPAEAVEPQVQEPEAVVEETPAERQERARDEAGRFAKTEGRQAAQETPQAPADGNPPAVAAQDAPPAAEAAPEGAPPPGWSPTAKAAWSDGSIPQAVKDSVLKREAEINKGFAKLQDYKGLDPFVELARNAGTTIQTAMENYVRAEQRLERNPVEGILWLCQQYGVNPAQLAPQRQPQAPEASPAAEQPAPLTPDVLAPFIQPLIAPLQQRIQSFEQHQYDQQARSVGAIIERFATDPANKYFGNVEDRVTNLLQHDPDIRSIPDLKERLTSAYQTACWADPEIRGLLIKEDQAKEAADKRAKAQAAANQARSAGRSITGSHAGVPQAPPPDNLREALEEAFKGARA